MLSVIITTDVFMIYIYTYVYINSKILLRGPGPTLCSAAYESRLTVASINRLYIGHHEVVLIKIKTWEGPEKNFV